MKHAPTIPPCLPWPPNPGMAAASVRRRRGVSRPRRRRSASDSGESRWTARWSSAVSPAAQPTPAGLCVGRRPPVRVAFVSLDLALGNTARWFQQTVARQIDCRAWHPDETVHAQRCRPAGAGACCQRDRKTGPLGVIPSPPRAAKARVHGDTRVPQGLRTLLVRFPSLPPSRCRPSGPCGSMYFVFCLHAHRHPVV